MKDGTKQRLFRFGIFEADGQTGELRKQGRRLSLQGQPFEILIMLLERPGELVTRGEIRERLWPEGTFVDFDHGLNTAVNKIRDALGDSAGSPRFVETLARRGYRFVAPVEALDGNPAASAERDSGIPQGSEELGSCLENRETGATHKKSGVVDGKNPPSGKNTEGWDTRSNASSENAVVGESKFRQRILTSATEMPVASHEVVRLLFLLLQVMYFCFYVISLARLRAVEELVAEAVSRPVWVVVVLVVTAVVGIPTRLYLMSAVGFNAPGLREKFLRIFPVIFPLDELWALAPFLLIQEIGYGLALGATAILLYVPFAERSLILMGAGRPAVPR